MKRTVVALALIAVTGAANAGLSFTTLSSATRTEAFDTDNAAVTTALGGLAAVAVGSTLNLGYLVTDQAGTVTYSYLGQESGYSDNLYKLSTSISPDLTEASGWYSSVSAATGVGKLDYKFGESDHPGVFAKNNISSESDWSPGTSIGLLGTNRTIGGNFYQYVIGYNDSAGAASLGDWDDYVVGVNLAPIPEPETYAMLIAGLGLMGVVARRRKQKAA